MYDLSVEEIKDFILAMMYFRSDRLFAGAGIFPKAELQAFSLMRQVPMPTDYIIAQAIHELSNHKLITYETKGSEDNIVVHYPGGAINRWAETDSFSDPVKSVVEKYGLVKKV
ncbi:MAG: hypothetical protein V4543_03890 [Bacteroidota bacterium]